MKVKRLKMQAFRGIDNLTLDFPETEPTVFIGINGAGKTSILDCLALILSKPIELIKGDPRRELSEDFPGNKSLENYPRSSSSFYGATSLSNEFELSEESSFRPQDINNKFNKTNEEIAILLNSQEVKLWNAYRHSEQQYRTEYGY